MLYIYAKTKKIKWQDTFPSSMFKDQWSINISDRFFRSFANFSVFN